MSGRRATSATIASGAPGTPPPSAASQQTSTAVADPDRKAPSPSSRLPIDLQINEQPLTAHAIIDLSQAHPSSSGYGAGTLIMGVVAPVIMAVLATPVWIMFFNV